MKIDFGRAQIESQPWQPQLQHRRRFLNRPHVRKAHLIRQALALPEVHRSTLLLYLEANARLAGYTGDSLSLKIIIALLIGLALYNAVELIVLGFVTLNK